MREFILILLAIIGLTWILLHYGIRQPVDDHIAKPSTTKLLNKHGVGGFECLRGVCTFERDGKVIRVKL